ncbi:hypothetical protein HU200_014676 [Digitaria exilis]|uniref:Leucine-rich repeat-containing N-terminal plant-type domain-containing protein n=1 Tax=Digitaria exilis TaxID=1010633 RepID=A0A835FAS0_9POAL|nr:hypothetical protein HU200_014676 [Digitaria exilis]CAB3493610.1 unnamed protein product [Digitaria exilis]
MPALLILVLMFLGHLPTWIAAATPANRGDAAAMLALANSTGTASPLGWGVKSSDPCDGTWAGVTCNAVGRVTSIHASHAGLAGVLHASDLGNLTFLAELDLSFNSLTTPTGDLPLLSSPLQHLRSLDLRNNSFYGIPEGFFAGFPNIETIALDDNPMISQIRPDVLTCSRLRSFSANNIRLLIRFPYYFGSTLVFPALERLSLAGNEITGTVPPGFGNHSKIKYLDISRQKDSLEPGSSLMGRMDFISGMESLVEVRMDHDGFVGPLPDTSKLVNLRVFSAAGNKLCGVPKFAGSVAVNLDGNPDVGSPC